MMSSCFREQSLLVFMRKEWKSSLKVNISLVWILQDKFIFLTTFLYLAIRKISLKIYYHTFSALYLLYLDFGSHHRQDNVCNVFLFKSGREPIAWAFIFIFPDKTHVIFNCSKKLALVEIKVYFTMVNLQQCIIFNFKFSVDSHHILCSWNRRSSTFRFSENS